MSEPGVPDDDLVILFTPALVAVLAHEENTIGRPLTQVEVESIRDRCDCVMSPRDVAEIVRDKRGYDDIDPENAWAEWQEIRRDVGDALTTELVKRDGAATLDRQAREHPRPPTMGGE